MIDNLFLISAAVILISALLTITAHNVVHALLYLVVTMLAVSMVFFLLGASFAAALQIIVYAGAIMVLFIFVTMMLHQGEKSLAQERHLFHFSTSIGAFILTLILFCELIFILFFMPLDIDNALTHTYHSEFISVKQIGKQLYGPYSLLVVISAMMLLSALITAIHISKSAHILPKTTKNQEAKL
ncbi:NADH-quinone oxidoreductase subunit J family protein [Pseudoalteromonas denitrificans]|uniref:NADH-quinone oxidoreductase subunit J n=1 Tax=Pseudoalteromonas denitrificans DSM 6059 TaxID=1123010 RepID=A0A1I1P3X9_9GAMM|nr:NADH-quinone oxidoreductase subunit J [Pseudoalteromonas denitrificans]SFD04272.1 NADH dehydrogenase subunit J [Pseudoalteromonas denitrificans DSM 6059]